MKIEVLIAGQVREPSSLASKLNDIDEVNSMTTPFGGAMVAHPTVKGTYGH